MLNLSNRVLQSKASSTVGIADRVQILRLQNQEVFDFSAGRAADNTPSYITEAAYVAAKNGHTHQTMARGTLTYRQAVAKKLERENNIIADPESELIATMGIKQGLTNCFLALLNPGDEVIVEDPCFVSYHQLISFCGGTPVAVPLRQQNHFRWDKNELEKHITTKTKAILFNSPHNPCGTVHSQQDLEMIAAVAKANDLYVVTDEVYERMTWQGNRHICLSTLPGMKERTITLMSLTKSYAMGGWRIGFAYAAPVFIQMMEKLQQHLITSVNSFVQAGAVKAFEKAPPPEVLNIWKEWEAKCMFATKEFNKTKSLSTYMPEGGFYAWTDISKTGMDSSTFCRRLLDEKSVACIPGASFGQMGKNFIRVTCVKPWDEIKEGIERIKEFVHE